MLLRMSNKIFTDELRGQYPMSELIRESGVARSTLWRWDRGIHQPNVATLQRIEAAVRRIQNRRSGQGDG